MLTYIVMFSIDAVGTGSDDQHQLQKSIEEIFLGVHQKKANLYNQTGTSIFLYISFGFRSCLISIIMF